MNKDLNKSLDIFKERTLGCLAEKGEIQRAYPILKNDLIYKKRCSVCGSVSNSIITEVYLKKLNFFTTSACNNCLFTFRLISPSLKWFKKCWRLIKSDEVELFNPEVENIRKKRHEKYYKILSKYISRGKVLDIGAGYGTGTKVFQSHGYDVNALEPEDNKAQYIKKALHIPVYKNDIESFLSTPPKKQYDLIIFAHCLEHLDNPAEIFPKLKKLLKPFGILYVEVPVLWNYVTWSDAMYLTHKSNFGQEHLTYFVKNHGFTIREKVNIRHSSKEPRDFGLVLTATDAFLRSKYANNKNRTMNSIYNLYKKNLPLSLPTNTKLTYNIPRIEQFYCTLKFENYIVAKSSSNTPTLIFIPKPV